MTDLVQQVETAVLTQLHGAHGLCSLQVQNHIYGCYILMEDIAMSHVALTGTVVSSEGYSFDIEKGFSEIGLRYGFLMDTTLELRGWSAAYKDAWMRCFTEMGASHDVDVVDQIEDKVNGVVHRSVPAEESFFMNAVENGTLTRVWIDKVLRLLRLLRLLRGGEKETGAEADADADADADDCVLSHAHIEKPITHDKKKRLSGTRRNKERRDGKEKHDGKERKDYLRTTHRRPRTAVSKN